MKELNTLEPGPISLPAFDGWLLSHHEFDEDEVLAIQASVASGRPLLVLGEPGTGKTQLARAAAVALGRNFVSHTLDAHTEAQDLFWTLDAVRRLAEAQISAAKVAGIPFIKREAGADVSHMRFSSNDVESLGKSLSEHPLSQATTRYLDEQLAELKFVIPGVLWWAFNWREADEQHTTSCGGGSRPRLPGVGPEDGTVVLLDEIDKADPVLPNALLEALGTGRIRGPRDRPSIEKSESAPEPLVVITSNQERELPHAFMRRCAVLRLTLPEDDALKSLLVRRGEKHASLWDVSPPDDEVLNRAATLLMEERNQGERRRRVGQAEFLDLLRAACHLESDNEKRLNILDRLSRFVLRKYSKPLRQMSYE